MSAIVEYNGCVVSNIPHIIVYSMFCFSIGRKVDRWMCKFKKDRRRRRLKRSKGRVIVRDGGWMERERERERERVRERERCNQNECRHTQYT